MKRFAFNGESQDDKAKTHVLGTPGDTTWVDVRSLTVSTSGGANTTTRDITITILDGGTARWVGNLRKAKEYGQHFPNIGMMKMTDAMTIVTTAGGGGDDLAVKVAVSCVYNCYTDAEEARKV